MAHWSCNKARVIGSALVLCWMSSTALASPEYGETLLYRSGGHAFKPSAAEEDKESPYQLRRNSLPAESSNLPSVQLLKNTAAEADNDGAKNNLTDSATANDSPTVASDTKPTKISIPNLHAMEEAPVKPFKPVMLEDDRPAQSVAEFKPLPWNPNSGGESSAEQLAALAPAAGPDAPLIPLPEAAAPQPPAPQVAAATNTASAPPPPATTPILTATETAVPPPPPLPALPTANEPEKQETKPASDVTDEEAARALDQALKDKVALNGKTELPENPPKLEQNEPKNKNAKKPAQQKTEQADVNKPYSPLDSEPESELSYASRRIAERIPSNIDRPRRAAQEDVVIDRARDLDRIFEDNPEVNKGGDVQAVQHEAMGIKIEVKNRNRNLDYELEKAYDALVTGQPSLAIEIYKNILANDPNNKGALFGLATTYHRSGQLDQARNFYGKLLAIAPKHRDGLNNFLVLLADEAPEQALAKMEELAQRNPDFSPIPAQMAVIHQRLGNHEQAIENMFRALALAPENMVYRYNLAIMLDKQKKYDEAARLYKQLIDAAGRGMTIPGNIQKIQQRLTFISSNRQ